MLTEEEVSQIECGSRAAGARVNGKGGRGRMKIERASGCTAAMKGTSLELCGTHAQIHLASVMVRCILAQAEGEVVLDEEDVADNCTLLQIPARNSRMVIGKGGEHLRAIEAEAHTIMCIAHVRGSNVDTDADTLVILGGRYGRRLSQLLIMGLVESITEGYFTFHWFDSNQVYENYGDCADGWGTHVHEDLNHDDMSFLIGKNAGTRFKLMKASGCVVARVGQLLFISGFEQNRSCALDYIDYLLEQRQRSNVYLGYVGIERPEGRKDCTMLQIPDNCVPYITGSHRHSLNELEAECGVLVFSVAKKPAKDAQSFAIMGPTRSRCSAELKIKLLIEHQRPGYVSNNLRRFVSPYQEFAVDYLPVDADDASYISGKQRITENKLMIASNAILKVIGNVCVVAGTGEERRRIRDYIEWLLLTKRGESLCIDYAHRSDVVEVDVPRSTGHLLSHADLREIELDSGTLLFRITTSRQDCVLVCGLEASKGGMKATQEIQKRLGIQAVTGNFGRRRFACSDKQSFRENTKQGCRSDDHSNHYAPRARQLHPPPPRRSEAGRSIQEHSGHDLSRPRKLRSRTPLGRRRPNRSIQDCSARIQLRSRSRTPLGRKKNHMERPPLPRYRPQW